LSSCAERDVFCVSFDIIFAGVSQWAGIGSNQNLFSLMRVKLFLAA
jgi:hypothetical protein